MGKHKRPAPPKPGLTLYNNLFVDLSQSETIGRISEGIIAVISNANRLLEDVSVWKNPVDWQVRDFYWQQQTKKWQKYTF